MSENLEVFLAGVVCVLAAYPRSVVERVVHPLHGLPGRCKFLPTIAEVREACETEGVAQEEHRDRMERYARLQSAVSDRWQSLPEPTREPAPPARANSTHSGLCERFGIRAVPPGWDAVDVTRAAAQHGASLQEAIDRGLQAQSSGRNMSVARQIVERARRAMEEREQFRERSGMRL